MKDIKRFLICSITVIVLLSACSESHNGTSDEDEGPGFYFEDDTYDFGEVTTPAFSDTLTFINKSSNTLRINSATTNHNAVYGSFITEPVPPGEEGKVFFRIEDKGILGPLTSEVEYKSDDGESKVIIISAHIVEEKDINDVDDSEAEEL